MKIDGRTLDHATLEQIRLMAIRRVREGEDPGSDKSFAGSMAAIRGNTDWISVCGRARSWRC